MNRRTTKYRLSSILSGFLCLLLFTQICTADNPSAYYRSYWHPIYQGQRLHYCGLDGVCGLKLATRYCRLMGYDRADQAMIAYNVGKTRLMEGQAYCHSWRCNGFKTIRCVSEFKHQPPHGYYYRQHRYVFPQFNQYRLAWCYDGQQRCGRKAAYAFCRQMGYRKAKNYKIDRRIGASKAFSNQKLCFGPSCNGFAYIDCFR